MGKYTPGPWKAIRHGNFIEIEPVISLSTKNQKMIDLRLVEHAEIMANANLIAAAPDLLEAGKKMVATWEKKFGAVMTGGELFKDLLAAIAKAEGRDK